MRTVALLGSLSLLLVAVAPAVHGQQPEEGLVEAQFALGRPFEVGEQWSTCGGVRLRATRKDWPTLEAQIAWTHSVQVVALPEGFALRGVLTSLVWEERHDGVQTLRTWSADAPGRLADPAARTWTFELDRAWTLRKVEGPEQSLRWLVEQLRPENDDPVIGELNRRLAERAATGVEAFLLATTDHLGQPVRKALASLRAGPILPGRSWTLESAHGTVGRAHYLGLEGDAGHFQATWDGDLAARFTIDPAGRLRWMNVQHVELVPLTDGAMVRAVDELAFGIVRIEGELPAWAPAALWR